MRPCTRQISGVGRPVLLLTRHLLRLPFCEYQHIPPCASVDIELLLQGNDSCPHPASSATKWTQRSPSERSSGNSSPNLWSTPTLSLGWGTWENYPSLLSLSGNKSHLAPRPKVGPCLNCFQLQVLNTVTVC